MKNALPIITLLCMCVNSLYAQTWSLDSLPSGKTIFTAGMTVVGDKLVIGGGIDETLISSDRAFVYDVSENTWTEGILSAPREILAAVTVDDKAIFVGGGEWQNGYVPSRMIDIYDDATGQWSTDTLPNAQLGLALAAVGDKVYIAGGLDSNSNETDLMLIYDPATGIFEQDSLPIPTSYATLVTIGSKLFLITNEKYLIFDPSTHNWEVADLPVPHTTFGGAVLTPTELWIIGGVPNRIDIYNIADGTWKVENTALEHSYCLATYLNGKVLIAGGNDGSSFATSLVETYNTTTNEWEELKELSAARQFFQWGPNSAPIIGEKAYFPGGVGNDNWTIFSGNVDVYDGMVSSLFTPKLQNLHIQTFPSPFSTTLNVQVDFKKPTSGSLEVYDINGGQIYLQEIDNQLVWGETIAAKTWASGTYLLKVRTADGVAIRKILKQ